MSRPTEPFPYGIGPEPARTVSRTDKQALTRLALLTLTGALLAALTRKATR